jgi:hypothetical protein
LPWAFIATLNAAPYIGDVSQLTLGDFDTKLALLTVIVETDDLFFTLTLNQVIQLLLFFLTPALPCPMHL